MNLIVGGSGILGSAITRRLLAEGAQLCRGGRRCEIRRARPALVNQTLDIGGPDNLTTMDVVRRVHPGVSQAIQRGILGETIDQTFDAGPLQERFAIALTSVEEWVTARTT